MIGGLGPLMLRYKYRLSRDYPGNAKLPQDPYHGPDLASIHADGYPRGLESLRVYLLGSRPLLLAISHRVSLSCRLLARRTWLSSTWRNELAPSWVLQDSYL
ncbi:uncharacterized protein AKAW2_11342A [Aspergillus luchuensis]|uniref:Uncharacterized protein n=1 Tax=Aspergillus kawachii TaxID=1069201 RepID=A0A7R7ZUT8_ASPKA|nr:uncharacterized protein AKAW2_11342A [Aspergillus luchuensis]BCR94296.1 hypothetical protein AKAW2_11342A [Aspergillus luchuensis]